MSACVWCVGVYVLCVYVRIGLCVCVCLHVLAFIYMYAGQFQEFICATYHIYIAPVQTL